MEQLADSIRESQSSTIWRRDGLAAKQLPMNGQNSKSLLDAALVRTWAHLTSCRVGPHSEEKQETEFWQSSTVAHATNCKYLASFLQHHFFSYWEGKDRLDEDSGWLQQRGWGEKEVRGSQEASWRGSEGQAASSKYRALVFNTVL